MTRRDITLLGNTAKAHLDKSEKYMDKYEQHRMSAGKTLLELQAECKAQGIAFQAQCAESGIGRSRAYEVMAIAGGSSSITPKTDEAVKSRHRKESRSYSRPSDCPRRGQTADTTREEPPEPQMSAEERAEIEKRVAESSERDELIKNLTNFIKRQDIGVLRTLARKIL